MPSHMLTETENHNRIAQLIRKIISKSDKAIVVIIDGDRTFIPTDSTKYFFEYLQKDYGAIKQIFKQHGYAFTGFHEVAKFYSTIENEEYDEACKYGSSRVAVYDAFLDFVDAIKGKAQLILVTAGIAKLWKEVVLRNGLEEMTVIGGNYLPQDSYIVDKIAKGIIASALVDAGKTVFAFGDTSIDYDMLAASHHPYIVVNERQNHDLIPLANQIAGISQITFDFEAHPEIPIVTIPEVIKLINEYYESSIR